MADTYGVTDEDVAAELIGLFRDGFDTSSVPTKDQVAGFISDADTIVRLHIVNATGVAPSATDDNARLARRYIIDATKAAIARVVYAGNDPERVDAAAKPYEQLAKDMLARIDELEPAADVTTELGWAGAPSSTTVNLPSWF